MSGEINMVDKARVFNVNNKTPKVILSPSFGEIQYIKLEWMEYSKELTLNFPMEGSWKLFLVSGPEYGLEQMPTNTIAEGILRGIPVIVSHDLENPSIFDDLLKSTF